jgi:hypothetical protein
MVVIGPYRALTIDINDLKSAAEGCPCIGTGEHHNEGEPHFLDLSANVESLMFEEILCPVLCAICL